MYTRRFFYALLGLTAVVVAGCTPTTDVSRNIGLDIGPVADAPRQNWDFAELVVNVPRSLIVSEAHGIKPRADIVWREEAPGDRYAQVEGIMRGGLEPALSSMNGDIPVQVVVEVTRFHALTEKARYTIGGVHAVQFKLTLVDPETGAALTEPRLIKADFKAYGGARAISAERSGLTQKVRITDRIAEVIQQELSNPGSTTTAGLGLMGVINQI